MSCSGPPSAQGPFAAFLLAFRRPRGLWHASDCASLLPPSSEAKASLSDDRSPEIPSLREHPLPRGSGGDIPLLGLGQGGLGAKSSAVG